MQKGFKTQKETKLYCQLFLEADAKADAQISVYREASPEARDVITGLAGDLSIWSGRFKG